MSKKLSIFLILILALKKGNAQTSAEVLDMDSVYVNGVIPFTTTVKQLIEKLGKPDSILSRNYDCGGYFEKPVEVYCYGQTRFEAFENEVVIREISFKEGKFNLKTTKQVWTNKTSLKDIGRYYPQAVDESYDWENPSNKKIYRIVRIQPKTNYDDLWVLKFYNGKLVEMEYWIPC